MLTAHPARHDTMQLARHGFVNFVAGERKLAHGGGFSLRMGAVARWLWIFVSIAGCPARPVLPKPLVFWQCISTKWKPVLDTKRVHTTGSFTVGQLNSKQKSFVAFGIVPKADSHRSRKQSLEILHVNQ